MGDYLIASSSPNARAARTLSRDIRASALAAGQSVMDLSPAVWLAVDGSRPLTRQTVGAWRLVGDVFSRQGTTSVANGERAGDDEQALMASIWGRYIGVRLAEDGQVAAILRDPSGALECLAWDQAGALLVASRAPDWLLRTHQPPWSINIERAAQALRDPLMSTGPLLIDGARSIGPGTVQPLPLDQPAHCAWRPSDHARLSLKSRVTAEDAAEALRSAVDEAVGHLGSLMGPLAVEVSGGLDSSIVAASLATGDARAVKVWINAYGQTPEADERRFVDALGKTLVISPLSVPHANGRLTEDLLESISGELRPGLNALDIHHDLDWVRRLGSAGVRALMTGKGGDSILLQAAGPDVFADLWRDRGLCALLSPILPRLAATNEVSIWAMLAAACRQRPNRARLVVDAPWLPPLAVVGGLHPWLVDCDDFGPAKAFQIAGVADSVSRHGRSPLTAAIDVRHPLCAQPVIETCLAIPTPVLALGGVGRGLARRAFQDRLPPLIAERRSKGDMTRIYGRMIADNLDVLRPWLLDGRLAAEGLIDRPALEAVLVRDDLMWRGQYSPIMRAAAFEGWLRVWGRRLEPRR